MSICDKKKTMLSQAQKKVLALLGCCLTAHSQMSVSHSFGRT